MRKKFLLDYRRNFNYYNFGGNHTNGVPYDQKNPDKISPFMAHLWETCGQKNNANKPPMASSQTVDTKITALNLRLCN